MSSAQTRTRPPRDTLDGVERAAPHTNHNKPQIEGRLNLVSAQVHPDPGNMGPLHEWLPEALWPKIKALEGLKQFSGLGDAMHSDSDDWLAWC